MKKHLINLFKLLMMIGLGFIIYFSGVLIINSVNDYRPVSFSPEINSPKGINSIHEQESYSILSWNIGYAGLGSNSDFFYDGGKMTRPGKDDFDSYWGSIQAQIQSFDSLDFLLMQEVDLASSRSYRTNQHHRLSGILNTHASIFGKNYDVTFVPLPIFSPMAKVISGLSLFSQFAIDNASCIIFSGNYSWPMVLFMPDRCFLLCSYTLPSGKKLIMINTHNSAFDDGFLRNQQLDILYEYMQNAYEEGHYVIAGGDWNMNPEAYTNASFISGDPAFKLSGLNGVSGPGPEWQVLFDSQYPTNRDVSTPYRHGQTPATIIDYFVCSPNINVLNIMTLYDGFMNSDHHPVYMRFGLTK